MDQMPSASLLQRVRHGAIGREPVKARDSEKQRISFQHPQVPQARAADQQHAHQRQRDVERDP
jgi:hypothetical protein